MTERPALNKDLDSRTFRDFYYLKEELLDFCRENDLPVSGGKILRNIEHFSGNILEVDFLSMWRFRNG